MCVRKSLKTKGGKLTLERGELAGAGSSGRRKSATSELNMHCSQSLIGASVSLLQRHVELVPQAYRGGRARDDERGDARARTGVRHTWMAAVAIVQFWLQTCSGGQEDIRRGSGRH